MSGPKNEPDEPSDGVSKLGDVAELAEVSISTVSRYVRGLPVRRSDAIAAAIEQLNYRPNALARGLRSRRTHAIGVVVADIKNPYVASLVRGIQSVVDASEYNLYLVDADEGLADAIEDLGSRVDGLICAAASGPEIIDALVATGRPTVLLEFEPVGHAHPFDAVMIDNRDGARRAGEYLVQLGHERVGIVAGPLTTLPGKERYDGFVAALEAAGHAIDVETDVEFGDFGAESGYHAAARLLSRTRTRPLTAIFAANNLMSLGTLKYLHDAGIAVPGEISFVGFDPIDWSELMSPSPTTVERPRSEQGAIAMRLLLDRMAGAASTDVRRIVLRSHLAVRESCGRPPDGASPRSR